MALKAADDPSGFSFDEDHGGALGRDRDGEMSAGDVVRDQQARVAIDFGDEGVERHVLEQCRDDEYAGCLWGNCEARRHARLSECEVIKSHERGHRVAEFQRQRAPHDFAAVLVIEN